MKSVDLKEKDKKREEKHSCKITYVLGLAIGTFLIMSNAFQATEEYSIIDTNAYIESVEMADIFVEANDELNIEKSILLATPKETITADEQKTFTGYKENTDVIFEITEKYPERFIPFCTIDPQDSEALAYLEECHNRGAMGLELYNGHSYYHAIFDITLDDSSMTAIYDYAESNNMPVLYHVNITKFEEELRNVLSAHPNMVVSIPSFMLSSLDLEIVTNLLDEYPNLYTDISFGSPEFMAAGFRRITTNPAKYANFMTEYSSRILFGTKMLLVDTESQNKEYIKEIVQCYKDLLEQRTFTCAPVADYYASIENQEYYDEVLELNGMALSSVVLSEIYESNAKDFLNITQEEVVEEIAEEVVEEIAEEVVEEVEEVVEEVPVVEEETPAEEPVEEITEETPIEEELVIEEETPVEEEPVVEEPVVEEETPVVEEVAEEVAEEA